MNYEPDFKYALDILKHSKPSNHSYALELLASAKYHDTLNVVLDVFTNNANIEAMHTALALLEEYLPDERVIKALQKVIVDTDDEYDEWTGQRSAELLIGLNAFPLEMLLQCLNKTCTGYIVLDELTIRDNIITAYGEMLVQTLLNLIQESENETERANAIEILGYIPDRRVLQPFYDLLNDPKENERVRGNAAFALRQFPNKPIISNLQNIYMISQGLNYLRENILLALLEIDQAKATPLVLEALHIPGRLATIATQALEKLVLPNARELYLSLLKDPSAVNKPILATIIAKQNLVDLLEPLRETLLRENEEAWGAQTLADAILQLGGEQAINWLLAQLEVIKNYETQRGIISSFCAVQADHLFEPLFALVEKHKYFGAEETSFLKRHRAKVVPRFLQLINNADSQLREWARRHITELDVEEAIEPLVVMLDEPNISGNEKASMIGLFGLIGDEEVLPKLEELRSHDDESVASAAEQAFHEIVYRYHGQGNALESTKLN